MSAGVPRVCLVVLDGWGLAPDGPGNAISLAQTPVFDALWERYPHTQLTAMGESVGLPAGQMGNSEVGHLNLGAGSIVPQDLARIDAACEDGSLAENPALRDAVRDAPRVHLLGLVSDGGVHSSDRHLRALLELFAEWDVPDVVLHAFTDGRDTLPTAGAGFVGEVEGWMRELGQRPRRHGRRALLRDGPRQALGPRAEGLRPARPRHGRRPRGDGRGGDAGRLRARGDRRVRLPDDRRRRGPDPPGRRGRDLQLPARPHARDHARARRSGVRGDRPRRRRADRALRDDDRVRGGLAVRGALPAAAPRDHDRPGDRRPRPRPAARRRDREVPARDVLLQRRRGGPLSRRGPRAGALAARRADLRPQAGDERGPGHRGLPRATGTPTTTRSRSSTSPTRTWSATPASSRRR